MSRKTKEFYDSLPGKKFGKLEVKEVLGSMRMNNKGALYIYCRCECECGNETKVKSAKLVHNEKVGRESCCFTCAKVKGGSKQGPRNYKGSGDVSKYHLRRIKENAFIRNLEFNLTTDYLWDLFQKQSGKCYYSGLSIELSKNTSKKSKYYKEQTASVDRIDSTKGYLPGNVAWVHKHVNYMKQDFTEDEFLSLCKTITNYKNL